MILTTTIKLFVFCLLVSFGFAACQSGQTTSDKTDSTSTNANSQTVGAKSKIPTITLESLIVSSDSLIAYRNSDFVFEYFFGDSVITLNGWVVKKGSSGSVAYGANPTMKLTPIGSTTATIGPNTYVCDQVLLKKDVQELAKKIKGIPGKTSLVFVPKRIGERINYSIFLLTTGAGQLEPAIPIDPALLTNTDLETNPSPPHGFN
ncbi:hypothetical protein [Spirosoma fluviale]|uniref:Lamin Tail Domain n=1 Tax=Spirosoma fluviale TaxID=1597977 RepID=A0A286GQN2_9BACT|nr:hypothetical protein [Spirosoma fluviale]SOD97855.1 hypothetical protein SAMN06269250_5944 [Spirosoma fluviale]